MPVLHDDLSSQAAVSWTRAWSASGAGPVADPSAPGEGLAEMFAAADS